MNRNRDRQSTEADHIAALENAIRTSREVEMRLREQQRIQREQARAASLDVAVHDSGTINIVNESSTYRTANFSITHSEPWQTEAATMATRARRGGRSFMSAEEARDRSAREAAAYNYMYNSMSDILSVERSEKPKCKKFDGDLKMLNNGNILNRVENKHRYARDWNEARNSIITMYGARKRTMLSEEAIIRAAKLRLGKLNREAKLIKIVSIFN